jgi:hypothetical protein
LYNLPECSAPANDSRKITDNKSLFLNGSAIFIHIVILVVSLIKKLVQIVKIVSFSKSKKNYYWCCPSAGILENLEEREK